MNTTLEKIEKLELELAELKKEVRKPQSFEIGKWYVSAEGKPTCICVKEKRGSGFYGYGVTYRNEWTDDGMLQDTTIKYMKVATPKEVEEALIKEAERRGFKEGVRFNCIDEGYEGVCEIDEMDNWFTSDEDGEALRVINIEENWDETCSNPSIYLNGKWAEIIKDEPIMIGSYEVKFNSDSIQVGCQTVTKETIEKIFKKLGGK